jgi:hypothetical protein
MQTFPFSFDPRFRTVLLAFGVTPSRAVVELDDERLRVRFGVWRLDTARDNVREARVTGPHKAYKALGIRTSMRDRGLTFGSSADRTVCIQFREEIRVEPFDLISHPALTVSVTDPYGLVAALQA